MPRITGAANFSELRTPIAPGIGDAVTSRPPATANFFVNSEDKPEGQGSGDFLITKNGESLFNGFFNRLTVNEIVLDWGLPNVSPYWGNARIRIQNTFTGNSIQINLVQSFYTVASCMEEIVVKANEGFIALGDPMRLRLDLLLGNLAFVSVGAGNDPFQVINDITNEKWLARQIFKKEQLGTIAVPNPAPIGPSGFPTLIATSPRILGTTYVDIVSQQLTYNQELKDNTTSAIRRDVLYRWYLAQEGTAFAYDQVLQEYPAGVAAPAVQILTNTNYPILQGYSPFVARRSPPFPKQIRWSPEQPIGQVSFQCYDDQGRLIDTDNFIITPIIVEPQANFQFQLSMLLSED